MREIWNIIIETIDYDRTSYYINIHILLAVASFFDEKIESEGEWHKERESENDREWVSERGRREGKRERVKETERGGERESKRNRERKRERE